MVMRLFKIISVSLAAVTAAGISTAAFAAETEGSGIAATSGEKGVVTYTFTEDITSVGTHTSSDGALVVNIQKEEYTNSKGNAWQTSFDENKLYLGGEKASNGDNTVMPNKVTNEPKETGDYVVYTVPEDGTISGISTQISWFLNIAGETCDLYTYDSNPTISVKAGDTVQFGTRKSESFIKSITFTPDTYDESYTFDITADELADKTLSVAYGSDTKEKPLSKLIATQTNGEGNVMLTGIRFTDIPKDVTISSVVIK